MIASPISALLPPALAWRPFLEPLPFTGPWWWLTLIPLAFGVAVVYKAVRAETLDNYWKHVLIMTFQTLFVMIAIGVGVHILVEFIVPLLD